MRSYTLSIMTKGVRWWKRVGMFVGREEGPERGQHKDVTERRLSNPMVPKTQNPLG